MEPQWQNVYGYHTIGGDAVYQCPNCREMHGYGLYQSIKHEYCTNCGQRNLYPWEKEMKNKVIRGCCFQCGEILYNEEQRADNVVCEILICTECQQKVERLIMDAMNKLTILEKENIERMIQSGPYTELSGTKES